MDGTIRVDLDARDIIARIMKDMEEVMDLIQRPTDGTGGRRPFMMSAMADMDPAPLQDAA